MSDASVDLLLRLRRLERLGLRDTQVTDAAAERLRGAFPDLVLGH